MTPKRWITIGIILFIIMTFNNLWIIVNLGPEVDMALDELWKIRNFENAQLIFWGIYATWLIYATLHILSIVMIVMGILKKQKIKTDDDIQELKNKVDRLESQKSFCKNCGNGIKDEKFCTKCGFELL
jgi:hypothetical protein